jgi:uncharacterized protein (DUF2249 family)
MRRGKMAVSPDMKVSEVLRKHPELLDVLVSQSPEFQRLRNPVLRKVMARLVTLRQAAAIAGIDPPELVAALNRALGVEEAPSEGAGPGSRTGPRPSWARDDLVAVELDVRDMQRRHEEPFSRIMQAVSSVQPGRIFKLRNTFEPFPLYEVLGRRGFAAWAERLADDDWVVYFYREAEPDEANRREADTLPDAVVPDRVLDIEELVPPEPMVKILTALEEMAPGQTLLVNHLRRPIYLLQILDERGYPYRLEERQEGRVQIYIRKPEVP